MGYTNYWKPTTRTPKPDILTKEFRDDISKLVIAANDNGISCHFTDDPNYIIVLDNTNHSEAFALGTGKDEYIKCMGFDRFCFCKTYANPFDAVVKCAIEIGVKHGIFEYEWSFDGDWSDEEYVKAVELAKKADVGIYGAMAGRLL